MSWARQYAPELVLYHTEHSPEQYLKSQETGIMKTKQFNFVQYCPSEKAEKCRYAL